PDAKSLAIVSRVSSSAVAVTMSIVRAARSTSTRVGFSEISTSPARSQPASWLGSPDPAGACRPTSSTFSHSPCRSTIGTVVPSKRCSCGSHATGSPAGSAKTGAPAAAAGRACCPVGGSSCASSTGRCGRISRAETTCRSACSFARLLRRAAVRVAAGLASCSADPATTTHTTTSATTAAAATPPPSHAARLDIGQWWHDRGMKILSIQSAVAYGHAGNSAAVFPMQRIGVEVLPVYTVNFSNHTGYGSWRGPVMAPQDVADVITGVEERGAFDSLDALLSGYQ